MFSVLFSSMRIMGKRQLGELEPIELTVAILISNLAAQPLADLDAEGDHQDQRKDVDPADDDLMAVPGERLEDR
ncbi:MAG: hypothetical protein II425_05530, partial [Oscillospiraceae bacterium]|nr:hypothetical protein [Oscillospiraceae bacterium]